MTYIYLIENCFGDPNAVYVGKTKIENSRKNKHIKTFGKNITCTTIDYINSDEKEIWGAIESYWISQFKTWGFKVQNKNLGGGGCVVASDDMREKISKGNKGKKRTQEHIEKYKGSKSQKHRENLSIAKKGKPSNKKGKKYGSNPKISLNLERSKKISQWLNNNKEKIRLARLGKTKKGCKILDVKNNIVFESKVACAKYNNFDINKMRKLVDKNIDYKRI